MTRWPEIRVPDNYIGLFEADSGFLRSELAITTWLRLAEKQAAHSYSTAR